MILPHKTLSQVTLEIDEAKKMIKALKRRGRDSLRDKLARDWATKLRVLEEQRSDLLRK